MTAGGQHNSFQQLSNKQPFITLSIIAIILAGVSVNFFIIGSLGIVPFIEYKDKILIPSVIVLAAIAIYSHFKIKPLSNRLLTGLWAGTLATLALEAVRIPSFMILHWLPGDDMIMMPGALLTGLAPSPMALMHMMQSGDMASIPYSIIMTVMTAGVIYHFWNGATLGAIYTVFVGRTIYLFFKLLLSYSLQ